MKRVMTTGLCLLLVLLSGCETMRGFGRDMQKAGSWVEHQVQGATE